MRALRIVYGVVIALVVIAAGLVAWAARHPEIPAEAPPDAATLDPALFERGQLLAELGDCAVCHTAPGGEPFAGGRALPTPFGVIHSTNITPDPATGIGSWSEAAFRRALHEGLDREGRHLYPAFPYDHFTRVTDDDVGAIYAYLMAQPAVAAEAVPNQLPFPLNIRLLVEGWKLLYFEPGVFQADPSKDEAWNRGAYLVEGLGHCGACHTPRNALGGLAEEHLGGGEAEGWVAPALDAASPAPLAWSEDALVNYLLDGWDEDHGIAAGPMKPVVESLGGQSEDDIYAIAGYLVAAQGREFSEDEDIDVRDFADSREFGSGEPPAAADPAAQRGAEIFGRSCANCHSSNGQTVPLALTSNIAGPDPRNIIHVVIEGIQPPANVPERSMPAFGGSLTDDQLVDLVTFLRTHFTEAEPWANVAEEVRAVRQAEAE